MFHRITDAFFAIDNDWEITYVNQRATEFIGRSRDELVGSNVREFFRGEESRALHEAYRRAFEGQEPITLEARSAVRPESGSKRIYPAKDGLSVYFQDITERKAMESEIRETKGKIEDLHAVAARVVACTTDDGIYDLAIEAAEDILEFDICSADAIVEGVLVPQAVSTKSSTNGYYEGNPIEEDGSLAAETVRTSRSKLVTDLHEAGYAPPKRPTSPP